jgi:hypothetical protein
MLLLPQPQAALLESHKQYRRLMAHMSAITFDGWPQMGRRASSAPLK